MSDSLESEFEEVEAAEEVQETEVEQKPHRSNYIDYEKDFEGVNPEVVTKVRTRIDEEFRKSKNYERQIKEAQKAKRSLEEKLLELKKPNEVALPSADLAISDPEEFDKRQTVYNESIKAQAQYEQEVQSRNAQLKAEQEREKQEQVADFAERAKTAGVDMNQAAMAAQIAMNSLPQELHSFLAYHDQAPQLLVKLANSPLEMQELASLNLVEAAVKLDRMANSFKRPTKSKAPPPDEPLKGSGTRSQRGPKGLTLE